MKKTIGYVGIALLLCFTTVSSFATNYTPMDAFISRMKTTNEFVTVSNIWTPDNNFDKTELLKIVEEAQPLTIDYAHVAEFMKANHSAISLVVPAENGGTYTIELGKYDILANDFEVHAVGENGKDTKVDYTPGLYYRGVVKGIQGSVASFSFFNNEVYGIFSIPDVGNFVLVPNSMTGKEWDYHRDYILYNDAKIIDKTQGPGCDADLLPDVYGEQKLGGKTTTFLNNMVYNSCTQLRIMEVADYDTYTKKGSNVTTVTNFLTALFNNQATIYRNEGVPIVLRYVQVNTAVDIYQSITIKQSIRFLKKFGGATKNVMHGCDLALLLSTVSGNMGGVAWLKALCSSYSFDSSGPYGFANISNSGVTNFPSYSWNLMVLAHEMGHIVGSPHTHRCCWNPPARNTAIDACMTLEGSCATPSPAYPSGGGTVMSYCHLQSVGINLTKGFGPQPGDTIRTHIRSKFSTTCGETYRPNVALQVSGKSLSANRECTDIYGGDTTTYYWFDKNTADQADDTLVLMIKKHRNNIGTLDSAGFSVMTATISGYGGGTADLVSFPAGTAGTSLTNNYAMRRYWKITTTQEPTSPVTVMFPFTAKDTTDVNGSTPGASPLTSYKFYKVNTPTNPNPGVDSIMFAPAANVTIYGYATTPSTSKWSYSNIGTTLFASMKMSTLNGGGTGFYPSSFTAVGDLYGGNPSLAVFPNPTKDEWNITTDAGTDPVMFRLYTADGRLVLEQELKPASVTAISGKALAAGLYFYRAVGGNNVYTGTLSKQ
ncbi:MAG: zinc-dependent metalloprotease [Flavipsychrobacter sp.]|nr:zinc-dependent metalloprotease [Flavipsychrobacter sp.]